MKILFKNVHLPEEYGFGMGSVNVLVNDKIIAYVGKDLPSGEADRIIEGQGNLLAPAFYNAHCHSAMTLFRGYGDDLALREWLDTKILPAEELLNDTRVYYGSVMAIAEMIKNGVVSFSDMYFFLDSTARAVGECGVKANISRSVVSFDPDLDVLTDSRIKEGLDAYNKWHNEFDGRLRVDMSVHAEYSNVEKCCRYVGELAKDLGTGIQLHLSETKSEHEKCIAERGMTPAEFFESTGVFDVPVTAAHCVWVSDSDIKILADKGVSVAHNPVSNLKLASGIMPYNKMRDAGINIALGTDGVASNNKLSVLREMQYAALIHKGNTYSACATRASDMIKCATENGARAQGREKCGRVEVGYNADLILVNMNSVNNIPVFSYDSALTYSACESDILITMCDGRILYEYGEYTSIDIEKITAEAKDVFAHYFD
ncbi:MAG: amidohydrolase [Ruminococcaceae bacterium]|nr:amidohydrolase [Oscillospiraceae bacterium]